MVYVADTESWQRIFQLVSEKSRWDLTDDEIGAYLTRSYDFIMDLFNRMDSSEPYALDPSGELPLRRAKRVRRAALRRGGEDTVYDEAQREFGMPHTVLQYHVKLDAPLFLPPGEARRS
jgi:hypothetical protein